MLIRLLLLLTVVPIVELIVLLQVHHAVAARWGNGIGLLVTIGGIVVTGVAGAALARYQGMGVLRKFAQSIERGELPGAALLEGVMVLVGAALLLTPGFLTDALGFSLLVPTTRNLYSKLVIAWFQRKIKRREIHVHVSGFGRAAGSPGTAEDDVIEAEFTRRD